MNKILVFSFCLIMSLISSAYSATDDKDWTFDPKTSTLIPKYLGKIKVISGKAIIGDRELKKGSKVYNNDLIQTEDKSYVVMEMIDLTTVTLGPNSDFKVAKWAYRTKNDREAEFNIIKGQWRALVKSKSKDSDQLKIKTPLVSLGIRGTELMVNVLKQNGKEVTQVALLEGSVHIEGEKPELSQDLVPGDHAVIVKNEKGYEHKDRKINSEEIKSYQGFIAPDVPRLLEPVAMDGSTTELSKEKSKNTATSQSTTSEEQTMTQPKTTVAPKSVEENLQLLNTVREENRKNK